MKTSITLASGRQMPLVGLGTWKIPKSDCANTVYEAIKLGYRSIDGAAEYGNEADVGKGVRRAIEDGIVKREDLFITSKLWVTDHAEEHVESAVKHSLKDWGIDYFDLYLIHAPVSLKHVPHNERYPAGYSNASRVVELANVPIQETWRALESLHDKGLLRNIGISNFMAVLIMDLLRYARIKPSVLQVEIHPYFTQVNLVRFCEAFKIHITAYSSFGPQGWIELNIPNTKKCETLFENSTIKAIAAHHGKTPGQVMLRWATQRHIAVIPKSNNLKRLSENLNSMDFDLSEDESASISRLERGLRFANLDSIDPRLSIFA